jgi:solute carrier family 40 (iron-regulated transporter), member 1
VLLSIVNLKGLVLEGGTNLSTGPTDSTEAAERWVYASIYGLCRSLAAAVLGPAVGAYIDSQDSLRAMNLCIVYQRLSVALSCVLIVSLRRLPEPEFALGDGLIPLLCFAAVAFLGGVEKLAAMSNLILLERDWLVVVAETHGIRRQDFNASLRRVDLLSKLLVPSVVGLIDASSPQLALAVVVVWNVASVVVESRTASQIYRAVPELTRKREFDHLTEMQPLSEETETQQDGTSILTTKLPLSLAPWEEYRNSPVFLASFILWWTVLYVGGPMIAYLLSIGFTLLQVTYFRIVSVVAELGGTCTWLAPITMDRYGPPRAGLYFLQWQVACLAIFAGPVLTHNITTMYAGIALALGTTCKRLGLWVLDLNIQFMIQEVSCAPYLHSITRRAKCYLHVTHHTSRSRFSATGAARQQVFDMMSSLTTTIYSRPKISSIRQRSVMEPFCLQLSAMHILCGNRARMQNFRSYPTRTTVDLFKAVYITVACAYM